MERVENVRNITNKDFKEGLEVYKMQHQHIILAA